MEHTAVEANVFDSSHPPVVRAECDLFTQKGLPRFKLPSGANGV